MIKLTTFLIFILVLTTSLVSAQPIAFPGAEGFGKYASGGRGGKVVIVTNLNDSGPGSLREAIRMKEPRIIIFALSGNIDLKSSLDINHGNVTIAGQSAPGDGICIRNYPLQVKADNVIIRFMRFRLGDESAIESDALGGTSGKQNIIIDHCSVSWSTDECASFYRNKNFTMQWCIISESLNKSVHAKGNHGYGGIWGGEKASFHHNLIASHSSRLPRFSGSSTTPNGPDELVDFRNNVIYNWMNNNTYGGERGRYNIVNNYYKPGPATKKGRLFQIINPWSPYGKFYVDGNYMEGNLQVSKDNWNGGVNADHPDSARTNIPFQVEPIPDQSAREAFESVLKMAGASVQRDQVDARIVREVRSGKSTCGKDKNGIIDSQKDVGGWPELKSPPAPDDKDADGIPDTWEVDHGLNPANNADAVELKEGYYSNIELYLNDLVKTVTISK